MIRDRFRGLRQKMCEHSHLHRLILTDDYWCDWDVRITYCHDCGSVRDANALEIVRKV